MSPLARADPSDAPAYDAARYQRIVDHLRARHGRMTVARQAIIVELLSARSHVTADDLAARVHGSHPDVHLSTIYRTLDTLQELGVIEHAHLGHGRAVYHLTDEQHQHLACERCDAVIEVPSELFDTLGREIDRRFGFAINPHHFALPGLCPGCRDRPSGG